MHEIVEVAPIAQDALEAVGTGAQLGHLGLVFRILRRQQNVTAFGRFVGSHAAVQDLGHNHLTVLVVGSHNGSRRLVEEFALVHIEFDLCQAQVPDVTLASILLLCKGFGVRSLFPKCSHVCHFCFHGRDVVGTCAKWNLHVADVSAFGLLELGILFVTVVVSLDVARGHFYFPVRDVFVKLRYVFHLRFLFCVDVVVLPLEAVGVQRIAEQGVHLFFLALGDDELLVTQQVHFALIRREHCAKVLLPKGLVFSIAEECPTHVGRVQRTKQHLLEFRIGDGQPQSVVGVIQQDVGGQIPPHLVLELVS